MLASRCRCFVQTSQLASGSRHVQNNVWQLARKSPAALSCRSISNSNSNHNIFNNRPLKHTRTFSSHNDNARVLDVTSLKNMYFHRFPLHHSGLRTVGREAEFPCVSADGGAADVQHLLGTLHELLPHLEKTMFDDDGKQKIWSLKGSLGEGVGVVEYCVEVGLGTVEIVGSPCKDLHEIARLFDTAASHLRRAASLTDIYVLGYGIQPVTAATEAFMTRRPRYVQQLHTCGPSWLSYTLTASDQCHVSMARDEVIRFSNLTNALVPVVIALCGNSSVFAGGVSDFCSAREGLMGRMREHHPWRHGMPMRPFDSLDHWCETICSHQVWVGTAADRGVPFAVVLQEGQASFADFQSHEKSVFHSSRPRGLTCTLEQRSACQQPWQDNMVVSALSLGFVESCAELEQCLKDHFATGAPGELPWKEMQQMHACAVSKGLDLGASELALISLVLELAQKGLRGRGMGEEKYLLPLVERLHSRSNPAQHAAAVFQKSGVRGLIKLTKL